MPFKYLTRLVIQLMEYYYVFIKRGECLQNNHLLSPWELSVPYKEKTSQPALWKMAPPIKQPGLGSVEPPDTARRDREGFLIKSSLFFFFFLLLIFLLSDSRCLTGGAE